MFKYLRKIGNALISDVRVYLIVLTIEMGIVGSFMLSIVSIWKRQWEQFPDSDFVFIGGNMIFWTYLVSLLINIPLARLGALLLRDRVEPLVELGLGRKQIYYLIIGLLFWPIVISLLIAVVLYVPLCLGIGNIPDDVGKTMVLVPAVALPSGIAIAAGIVAIVIPSVVSVVAFAGGLLKKARARKNPVKIVLSVLVNLCLFLVGAGLIKAGFGKKEQAGLLFALGVLLIGALCAAKVLPGVLVFLSTLSSRIWGERPWIVSYRLLLVKFKNRIGGLCQILFVLVGIPSLLFTASSQQRIAQGYGGIAQWDYWILLGCPTVLIFIGFLGVVIVFSRLMSAECKSLIPLGFSLSSLKLTVVSVFYSIIVGVTLLLVLALIVLAMLMASVWGITGFAALSGINLYIVCVVDVICLFFSWIIYYSVLRKD